MAKTKQNEINTIFYVKPSNDFSPGWDWTKKNEFAGSYVGFEFPQYDRIVGIGLDLGEIALIQSLREDTSPIGIEHRHREAKQLSLPLPKTLAARLFSYFSKVQLTTPEPTSTNCHLTAIEVHTGITLPNVQAERPAIDNLKKTSGEAYGNNPVIPVGSHILTSCDALANLPSTEMRPQYPVMHSQIALPDGYRFQTVTFGGHSGITHCSNTDFDTAYRDICLLYPLDGPAPDADISMRYHVILPQENRDYGTNLKGEHIMGNHGNMMCG